MKLANPEYNLCLELEENRPTFLIIENNILRFKLVEDIYNQCIGSEGGFVLSEDLQMLKMSKNAEIIINPFSIDVNSKKVLTKLYQEISDYCNENYYEEKERINGEIVLLLDKIMLNVPYNITTKFEIDIIEICKLYNVELENSGDTLIEKLLEYIKIVSQLCSYKLFILLNFSLYLTTNELQELYKFASYQKVYLLLVEYIMPLKLVNEKGYIIDKDSCIIEFGNDLQHFPSVKFGENPN